MNNIMDTKVFILMFLAIIATMRVDGRHRKKNQPCNPLRSSTNNGTTKFDLLLLRISWLPTMCYSHRKGYPKKSCHNLDKNYQWSIHGLWPSLIGQVSSRHCNCSAKYDPTKIIDLKPDLEVKWTNIEDDDGNKFWGGEYFKHGSCASSVDQLNTQFKYFNQTLKLFEKYNISKIFENANIKLGHSYKEKEIIEGVRKQVGKLISVTCKNESIVNKFFLATITLCFDKSLSLIDCVRNKNYPDYCPSLRNSAKIEFSDMQEMIDSLTTYL